MSKLTMSAQAQATAGEVETTFPGARHISASVLAEQTASRESKGDEFVAVRLYLSGEHDLVSLSELREGDHYILESAREKVNGDSRLKDFKRSQRSAQRKHMKHFWKPLFIGGIATLPLSVALALLITPVLGFLSIPGVLAMLTSLAFFDDDTHVMITEKLRELIKDEVFPVPVSALEGLREGVLSDSDLMALVRIERDRVETRAKVQEVEKFLAKNPNPMGRESVEKRLTGARAKLEGFQSELLELDFEEKGVLAAVQERALAKGVTHG